MSRIADHRSRFDAWFRRMLPVWTGPAWRPEPGTCVELLDARLQPLPGAFHRLTIVGRQLVVFSLAFERWRDAAAAARARTLVDTVAARFRDHEQGGFYFSIAPDGSPKDSRKDLYAHAFAMFGLATFARVFGEAGALDLAREADRAVEAHLRTPRGWCLAETDRAWNPPDRLLRQNPHMHLFEAYLALYETTGEAVWSQKAQSLLRLLNEVVAAPGNGALRELLDENGLEAPGLDLWAEPGHHFEWYWLIDRLRRLAPTAQCPLDTEQLFTWAEQVGVDATGGTPLTVHARSGAVIDPAKRLWPLTERIKAEIVRLVAGRAGGTAAKLERSLDLLTGRYLIPDGGWHEYLAADLTPVPGPLPTSSAYHLMLALTELDRIEG